MFRLILFIIIIAIGVLTYKAKGKKGRVALIVLDVFLGLILIASIALPAILFTDYQGRPTTGPYEVKQCQAILIDSARQDIFENDGSSREVPVYFYYPEGVTEEDSLPLVIFSHGAFGYYQSNTSTYMELASNGYVVVSLDHPHHSFYTHDTSGKTVIVDREFIQTAMYLQGNDDTDAQETYDITSAWMELREEDMNFVIDTIKAAAASGELDDAWFTEETAREDVLDTVSLIDSTKIGLMGHSLGGATAVTVGRREDVSAAIDLDGTMIGEETGVIDGVYQIDERPYTTPLLAIDSESHHNSRVEARGEGYVYANNVILDNATTGYSTYIEGAEHMNFTDLPLFSPMLAQNLGIGNVDAGECIDQVNALVLSFFDCYLKGEGTFTVNDSY
ncbi:MAG: dienelactone hydrolase family protein [Clostridiales bacterium]|nr:dienelactone hydrolase family protein [Clostridiales bacterium]